MRLTALPTENQPTPTSYYIVVRDNGDGTFTDVKVPIKNSYSKMYKFLISQSSTLAPTVKEQLNTLGGTPALTYVGVGNYQLVLSAAFTANKTHIMVSSNGGTPCKAFWIDANTITFKTYTISGGAFVTVDGVLSDLAVTIEIQP